MTYQEIINDTRTFFLQYGDLLTNEYKAVLPIPSGGIVPGILISYWTKLPALSLKEYQEYKNKKEVLIVDDLIDSGKTMEKYPESNWATLYVKDNSPRPTYYLRKIENKWLELPHEKGEIGIEEHIERIKQFQREKHLIGIKTSFVAFHRYKDAPEEVEFLKNTHRHKFNVEMQLEVDGLNRDKEFFIEQAKLDSFLAGFILDDEPLEMSCEMIAKEIFDRFNAYSVRVDEDGENYGEVKKLI